MVKKLFLILAMFGILLSACAPATVTVDQQALEQAQGQIATLQAQVAEAQQAGQAQQEVQALQQQLEEAKKAAEAAKEQLATAATAAAPKPTEVPVQKLTVWTHEFPPLQDAFTNKWIPEFEASHPGVKVEMTAIPFAGVVAYDAKLLAALSSGEGPDLWDMGDWDYKKFQDINFLAAFDPTIFGYDSDQEMIDAYAPGSMTVFVKDGKVYGLFSEFNTLAMFYNLDMFQAAGIEPPSADKPVDWDTIGEMGQKLYKKDPNTGAVTQMGWQWGFFANYRSPQWYAQGFYPLLRQNGQDDIYIDGKPAADSEAAVKAFQTIYDLQYKYNAYDPTFINGWFSDMPQGRIGMVLAGTWFEPAAMQNNPDFKFGVAPHPVVNPEDKNTYKNIEWSWGWSVNAQKPIEQQMLAQEFMAFILGKKGETDQAAWWFDNLGYMQPSNAFLTSDTYKKTLEEKPWLQVWVDAFDTYEIGYIQHSYDEAGVALMRAIDRIIYDGMKPAETADILQAELLRLGQ